MHNYNLASSIRGFRLSLIVIPLCFYTIEIQAVAVHGLKINITQGETIAVEVQEASAVEVDEAKESATDLRRILTLNNFPALDLDYTDLTLVNKDDNIAIVYNYDTDDAESYGLLNALDEQIINLSKNTSYLQQRKKLNCSRHTGEKLLEKLNHRQYNMANNYVNANGQFYNSVSLARDAKAIVEAEGNSWARSRTVVFCVALRDKWGYGKKFAFHNGEKIMSKDMFERAETLGYDVIQTEQSHAEVQFLQFLRRRDQDRPGWYTHIIGMGCSKKHCAECDHLIKFLLAANYQKVTAAVNDGKAQTNSSSKVLPDVSYNSEISAPNFEFIQSREVLFEVVTDAKAIDDQTYNNYYLPIDIQEWAASCSNKKLDFSNPRFTKLLQSGNKKVKKKPAKRTKSTNELALQEKFVKNLLDKDVPVAEIKELLELSDEQLKILLTNLALDSVEEE